MSNNSKRLEQCDFCTVKIDLWSLFYSVLQMIVQFQNWDPDNIIHPLSNQINNSVSMMCGDNAYHVVAEFDFERKEYLGGLDWLDPCPVKIWPHPIPIQLSFLGVFWAGLCPSNRNLVSRHSNFQDKQEDLIEGLNLLQLQGLLKEGERWLLLEDTLLWQFGHKDLTSLDLQIHSDIVPILTWSKDMTFNNQTKTLVKMICP